MIDYSEGLCADGAAILKDGVPMRIHEIVETLIRQQRDLEIAQDSAIRLQRTVDRLREDLSASEITSDIMKIAEAAWFEADEKIIRLDAQMVIARAIAAERERCAKICEDWPDRLISKPTLWKVAGSIRGKSEPPK